MSAIRTVRTCRYEHGPLNRQPGEWAFIGLDRRLVSSPDSLEPQYISLHSGQLFIVEMWICPACGYVETVDGEL